MATSPSEASADQPAASAKAGASSGASIATNRRHGPAPRSAAASSSAAGRPRIRSCNTSAASGIAPVLWARSTAGGPGASPRPSTPSARASGDTSNNINSTGEGTTRATGYAHTTATLATAAARPSARRPASTNTHVGASGPATATASCPSCHSGKPRLSATQPAITAPTTRARQRPSARPDADPADLHGADMRAQPTSPAPATANLRRTLACAGWTGL